jgi:hypothetical protein
MTKYNIEGGLDFYSELYGSLEEIDCEDEKVCLITNEPLVDRHVKMNCGHAFNYDPLYKDLVNHLTKFNNMEGSTGVLGKNEIRCPYCRAKQKGVLPYYPELGLKRIEGVNTASIPPQICSFVWDNEDFDEGFPENFVNPKTIKCMHLGSILIKDGANDVFYCTKHNKDVLSKQAKALKEQQKQEKLANKLKQKEEIALAKASAKVVADANKALAKANANNKANADAISGENAVIATNISIPVEYDPHLCVEILRTGDRKGQQCSLHKIQGQDMCRRHYNLMIKKNL